MVSQQQEDTLFSDMEIQSAIAQLPEGQRAVIAMRTAGYPRDQIGTLLGYTKPAIRYIEQKAVGTLRVLLGG